MKPEISKTSEVWVCRRRSMETTQIIKTFGFSFRIHMSLVHYGLSRVDEQVRSRTKSDHPGRSASAREAHLKCCVQICYSLALITKGSVRTLVRSVEESNGAEARRLIHSRYAPDTESSVCVDAEDHDGREALV